MVLNCFKKIPWVHNSTTYLLSQISAMILVACFPARAWGRNADFSKIKMIPGGFKMAGERRRREERGLLSGSVFTSHELLLGHVGRTAQKCRVHVWRGRRLGREDARCGFSRWGRGGLEANVGTAREYLSYGMCFLGFILVLLLHAMTAAEKRPAGV